MIHRITLHFLITADYAKRNVFPRYASAGRLNDLSVRVSTAELKALLDDADAHTKVTAVLYPNLAIAYICFARKARKMLKYDGHYASQRSTDSKSLAAGEKEDD